MVYRGKPSAGCGRCRRRRLKCDQQRPSCSQCIRANQKCSGYRDLVALAFRDQTEEVIRKGRRPQSDATVLKETSVRPPARTAKGNVQAGLLALSSISVPMNDQATGFVFSHYVWSGSDHTPGYLGYLYTILTTEAGPAVTSSINAVGLAALSNIYISPNLMLVARREYTAALAATNAALQDRECFKSDSTLAAIVLLGMYEVMTCRGPASIDRWLRHIEGAMKLVEIRGSEQLQRPAGLELFTQLRVQIALTNIYREKYMPPWLAQLSEEALAYRDPKNRGGDQLFNVVVHLGNFCASIRDGTLDDSAAAIRMALHLDAELASWATSVSPNWQYTVVEVLVADNEDCTFRPIYGDHYHVYSGIGIRTLWNNYRTIRILVHEIILNFCDRIRHRDKKGASELRILAAQSTTLARKLAEDICASVPSHFGTTESRVADTLSESKVANHRGAGGFLLTWPLFMAADSVGSSPSLRAWIINCLDKVGHCMGINQALAMAQLLRDGKPSRSWLTATDSLEESFEEEFALAAWQSAQPVSKASSPATVELR